MEVISVENVSKRYRLGVINNARLIDEFQIFLDKIRGKGNRSNAIAGAEMSGEHWALNDVSFSVKQGEVLGIVGHNGAGKSTMLKILSRITTPTEGQIKIKGRMASLLEVGTGFQPELTGRENVYLNGAILGMSKNEIHRKIDEIIDFSGISKFVDTPVKRYSSGMYVRLAFAVAAHLEPEILVVDEVLAVGDADFQKQCLGKMKEVSGEGRTVLFVSHNMQAVQNLCTRGLLLDKGQLKMEGTPEAIVQRYMGDLVGKASYEKQWHEKDRPGDDVVKLERLKLTPQYKDGDDQITVQTPMEFVYDYEVVGDLGKVCFHLKLHSMEGICIFEVGTPWLTESKGRHSAKCHIPGDFLNDGIYFVEVYMRMENNKFWHGTELITFEVLDSDQDRPERKTGWHQKWPGAIRPILDWQYE